ncbi:unnamed protein product [Symbiodinium sp. CCMP2592]|nr:unnamed protein product [Symbiodinium sp. CCMP2592]
MSQIGHWPSVWESARWKAPKARKPKVQPPPGLDGRIQWPARVLEAVKAHWDSFDSKLQETFRAHGAHCKPMPQPEPDLKEVCKQHLSSLPESIQRLLQEPKQEIPCGQAVSDLNRRFKAETSCLRDLVQQSVSLQARIDKAKQTYEELLRSMQTLTEQLSAKQAEVEDLQKQLQVKLGEFDNKVEPPVEDSTLFEAFFDAMSRAGVQLDAEAEQRVRAQLATAPAQAKTGAQVQPGMHVQHQGLPDQAMPKAGEAEALQAGQAGKKDRSRSPRAKDGASQG